MSPDVAAQLAALWQGAALGGAMGLVYDLFRVVRARVKVPLLGPALDFTFWLVVTVALFVWSQWAWGGLIRLYGAVFCFGGGVLYFRLVSPWALRLGWLCADGTALALRLALLPLRAAMAGAKKIREFFKILFLFRRKWYRIDQINQDMERVDRRLTSGEGRVAAHEAETGQFFDQGDHFGAAGVHGHHSAGSAGPH